MIQRKQSLFLLVAALLNACLLVVPFYRWHEMISGSDVVHELRVNDHYPSLIITIVIVLLPVLAIFMFRSRSRQMGLSAAAMVSTIGFITMMLSRAGKEPSAAATGSTYWIGAVLPIISIVFIILAMLGIRKDEKLVRSADRLR
jgi:glucose-6-phosphate-specific signal transduction histidine kinase